MYRGNFNELGVGAGLTWVIGWGLLLIGDKHVLLSMDMEEPLLNKY
jgi:hypothetical protein